MKVRVDGTRCQGHTLCAMIAPEVFELDDIDGHARPVDEQVPNESRRRVREAARSCPEQAIRTEVDRSGSALPQNGATL